MKQKLQKAESDRQFFRSERNLLQDSVLRSESQVGRLSDAHRELARQLQERRVELETQKMISYKLKDQLKNLLTSSDSAKTVAESEKKYEDLLKDFTLLGESL